MNKLILSAAIAAATIATPVLAQEGPAPATVDVTGTIALSCTVTNFQNPDPTPLDLLNSSTAQNAGSLSYKCNNANGFTRTITSANTGNLKGVNTGNTIAYTFSHGGGSGLNFAAVSLSTPKITSHNGSTAFIAGQTGSANFTVGAGGGSLFADTYKDTVTVTVSPN